ncbi:MAG TPA: glycoside hydrolase family 38 C-terminal domain-containing protein [Edaphobacter sp.]|uniref:glycoside hydrolase family 38 C-terminal domain-containing protein n=1 Tax=Edaphobacter sp. TaxID=1934404 RepID=UPI002C434AB6|nr:glycoside hydrolase family 38 C-terminal domain-containing protein [Edaphobacter sp.]HUZ97277.1 glycoside hydrolase family 38 C-terminal domain-containing protein [Edaphobacter sp.]
MKRRDVLKGLSIVAGGALCTTPALSAFALDGDKPAAVPPLALAIRGLIRKDGKLMQPIQIFVQNPGAGAAVVTTLNGTEIDSRTLASGQHTFNVLIDAVTEARDGSVTVKAGENTSSAVVKLQPVRKVLVYVLPHSHHDLGYTDLQANVEEKQMQNITLGMELAKKTAGYPEGSRFVWNLEVLWGADLFMRRRPQGERDAFVEAVKKGWVAINGMYANELTGLCRPEELMQLFRYGTELGKTCGVRVDSAMISDVPGYTWGTVTAMSQAGIRYFSAAPNFFDRIGSLMEEWQDKPFWAVSPSGKEKVLVWIPWTGYAMSHVMKLSPEWVGKYQDRLDTAGFRYDISYIRWSGHGDNAVPDPELSEFIKGWNEEYEWPKFHISSTSEAFSAFEKRHGSEVPEMHGDLTPYWEDGAGSSALETKMNRVAADRLTQAEALGAMFSPAALSTAKVNEAWRNILLYSEHTWGAWCSVSDSESDFTKKQWDVKRQFAVDAESMSKSLLDGALKSAGAGSDAAAIDVHNSTSWPRSELVVLSAAMSAAGDHVKTEHGASVPSQRLSSGELAFLAQDVPAFGSARFHLSRAKALAPAKHVTFKDGVLENSVLRVKIDAATGNVVEMSRHGKTENLVDSSQGQAANEYLFLEGGDVSKVQQSGAATIHVEEAGPLVVSVRVESAAPGCNSLVRRVRLVAGEDHVELTNVVDKKRAPLNPHPGKGGPGDDFAQREAKESVQFAFPFAVRDGAMRMDIPLGMMRPEIDQLPGACKNWLPVGRWIDVSNAEHGVTWVTLDAPLVEVGEISANMLGSQRDPKLWRHHIAPTQKFYSWAMNNHWGTNYRAYQEGVVEFRYALRPHAGYDAAAASRFAIGLSQPLVTTVASAGAVKPALLRVEPQDVLALALKAGDDGAGTVIRLFGASGEERRATLTWTAPVAPQLWISDLSEQRVKRVEHEVTVAGWDLVTLRADHA